MNLRAIRRTTLDNTLKLARLPFDCAVRLIAGDAAGAKSAAKRAIDRADALMRAVVGVSMPEASPRPDARARSHAAPQESPTLHRRQATPHERRRAPARPPSQRAAAARRPAPSRIAPAPQRAAASPEPAPALQATPGASAPPSQEDIAVRAYELYQGGMPGGADEHWREAERELSARHD
jgi:hypothetical protein